MISTLAGMLGRIGHAFARCVYWLRYATAPTRRPPRGLPSNDGRLFERARFWRELREGQREAEAAERARTNSDAIAHGLGTK